MERLKTVFDPSVQRKIEEAQAQGTKPKEVENMVLDAKASALLGVSKQRGQAALECVGLSTVSDVLSSPTESSFARLPADIRKACESAWNQARESVIYY
jgi:hypothetical protein